MQHKTENKLSMNVCSCDQLKEVSITNGLLSAHRIFSSFAGNYFLARFLLCSKLIVSRKVKFVLFRKRFNIKYQYSSGITA